MGGYNSLPMQPRTNPYLDEIDAAAQNAHAQLSPGAQQALQKAGAPILGQPAQLTAPTPQIATPPTIKTPSIAPPVSGSDEYESGPPLPHPAITAPAAVPAPAGMTRAQSELDRLNQTGSGISQIKHAGARIPLQILEAIGTGFAPGLTSAIPGTQLHHNMLVNEQAGAVKQGEAGRKSEEEAQTQAANVGHLGEESRHLGAETDTLIPAQALHLGAQADALANPQKNEVPHTVETDQGILQYNPETKRYDILVGGVLGKKEGGTIHQDEEGNFIMAYPDGTAKRVTINGTPVKGKPPAATGESTDVKNYQFAKEQGYKGSFEQWQVDEANRKQPRPGTEPGTWTLSEDEQGKPILFNSKTGQTRAAPGIQRPGTHAKEDEATRPAREAIDYANTYLQGGKFTGAGDEALMEKYFELAAPSKGFRMTKDQMAMLQKARGWRESLAATARHAVSGTYFDNGQRQEIVNAMQDLSKSKLANAPGGQPASDNALPGGISIQDIDAEIARRKGAKK